VELRHLRYFVAVAETQNVLRAATQKQVRAKFRRVKPLAKIDASQRGWTLDVLNPIRTLDKPEFTTNDAYELIPQLQRLHQHNRHVREKIRQQLRVLRDSGLLTQCRVANGE
jgi:type II restriction enzyme